MDHLDTDRTWMRPFHQDDLEEAFAWFGDPAVMKYIPTGLDKTLNDSADRLLKYIVHQETYGFSKWMVFDRETGEPIGDAGLYHLPDGERIELGYRLRPSHWGKGLATELARAWARAAFETYGMDQIYAFAFPENAASQRVMQKVGFHYLREETFFGFYCPLYGLARDQMV